MTTSRFKTCFKCEQHLPLSDFYKNSKMADGHLNKCKECTKTDVALHRERYPERHRRWDREKQQRYRDEGRYQDRRNASKAVRLAIRSGRLEKPEACWHCGQSPCEAHHVSYDEDMYLAVSWLCKPCHRQVHEEFNEATK